MFGLGKLKAKIRNIEAWIDSQKVADGIHAEFRRKVEKTLESLRGQCGDTVKASYIVTCEECGCLVGNKQFAVKGKSEIRTRQGWRPDRYGGYSIEEFTEEYIHTPYYCKICGEGK